MTAEWLEARGAWGSGLEWEEEWDWGGTQRHPRTGQANQGPRAAQMPARSMGQSPGPSCGRRGWGAGVAQQGAD